MPFNQSRPSDSTVQRALRENRWSAGTNYIPLHLLTGVTVAKPHLKSMDSDSKTRWVNLKNKVMLLTSLIPCWVMEAFRPSTVFSRVPLFETLQPQHVQFVISSREKKTQLLRSSKSVGEAASESSCIVFHSMEDLSNQLLPLYCTINHTLTWVKARITQPYLQLWVSAVYRAC